MKILGIETSSPLFSLCVNQEEKILYEIRKNRLMNASNRDAQFFAEAKRIIDYFEGDNISAIAVSIGPGMFTSLRIGLSLAKGFAFAKSIPIVAVNTLDVIGFSMSFSQYPVLAVINAYHQEIYGALYKNGTRTTDYLLTTPGDVKKIVKNETVVVGSGVEVFRKNKEQLDTKKLHFIDDDFLLPTASKVVDVSLLRIRNKKFDNPELLEPFYIKKTDAERNYNKANAI